MNIVPKAAFKNSEPTEQKTLIEQAEGNCGNGKVFPLIGTLF